MLTQAGSSLPGAAFACVSGGPGWWGAVGGGWISRCVRTWMRSVCMNGQGTSLKAGPKEIRTQCITWQLESPLHSVFVEAEVGASCSSGQMHAKVRAGHCMVQVALVSNHTQRIFHLSCQLSHFLAQKGLKTPRRAATRNYHVWGNRIGKCETTEQIFQTGLA